MDSTRAQLGVRELTGNNDGIEVEAYLRSVGLKKGNPYCQAGQYWSFWVAATCLGIPLHAIPLLRTGLAAACFNDAARKGTQTKAIPQELDLVYWKFSKTIKGHTERIEKINRAGWILTNGYNIQVSSKGDQREGGGVGQRQRNINYPLGRMLVSGFIGRKKQ